MFMQMFYMAPLKQLSNFCRTLEMPLINCKITLFLTWSKNWVLSDNNANQAITFTRTHTKFYVPVAALLT